jgi:hypothetical protein
MVICLVASLAVTACGDDSDSGNNGGGNNGADVGDQDTGDQDAGDQDAGDQDTGDQDTGDQDTGDQDAGDQDTDNGGPDVTGLTVPSGLELDETDSSWSLFAETDTQLISLSLNKEGGATGTGQFQFEDVVLDEANNTLITADGCTDQGCRAFFMATSGTLDITAFETDVEGGSFEANLSNVGLVEIEQTQAGFQKVDGGETWLIDSADISATTDPSDTFPTTVACDTQGFTAADGTASATATNGGALIVDAANSDTAPQDALSLQIYPSFAGAATTAGQYQLDDYNFASCANCLLIYAGCDDQGTCQKTYSAGAGTLDITAAGTTDDAFVVGEQFTATLTDAKLVEVTISDSYDTEFVEDGADWCVDSYSWDLTIIEPAQSP